MDIPIGTFYIDTLFSTYSFENIKIQATDAEDEFNIEGVQCAYNGKGFPLSGSDFLAAVTDTLYITAQELSQGLHFFLFSNSTPAYPAIGMAANGLGVIGLRSKVFLSVGVQVQVQSFSIPGVALPSEGQAGVPILSR